MKTRIAPLAVLAVLGIAPLQAGTLDTVPPGLVNGQTYRLVFVTSDTTDATSTDISVYNSFVQAAANSNPALAALGATWTVIGSTGAVNAVDNISWLPATDQIYGLDGTLVSEPTHPLFFDSNDAFFDAPIPTDENGNPVSSGITVWTGTSRVGTNTVNGCCTAPLGNSSAFDGMTGSANVFATFVSGGAVNTQQHPLYAISSELTVGAPEPGTWAMMALGTLLLVWKIRRHKAA